METVKNIQKMENKMIIVIRIEGMVKVKPDIAETLDRMRLRRKYAAVLLNNSESIRGMLKKVKYSVSYGEISKETLAMLLEKRAHKIDNKKFDSVKVAEELHSGKNLSELGFKPFFRLHPPRKGINSKLQYPKGVLGHNKEINKLVERML